MTDLVIRERLTGPHAYSMREELSNWLSENMGKWHGDHSCWNPDIVEMRKTNRTSYISWMLMNGIVNRVFGKGLYADQDVRSKSVLEAKDWVLGIFLIRGDELNHTGVYDHTYSVIMKVKDPIIAMQLKLTYM